MWGGHSVAPPAVNVSAFSDIYILTIPSFIWLKVFPDRHGNATYQYGHYAASSDMVLGNSQMFIIGGTYPNRGDADMCDLAQSAWAQHNLFTGTKGNVGDDPEGIYWALPNTSITSNVVPMDVYNVVGGDKNGGATLLSPKSGYDTPNGGLQTLLTRKPTFEARSATRPLSTGPTTTASATTVPPPSSGPSPLSTGAIVGIAIGSAVALGLIIFTWCVIGRRIRRRRQQRLQSQMTEPNYGARIDSPQSQMSAPYYGPRIASPQSGQSRLGSAAGSPGQPDYTGPTVPPAELDVQRATSASPGFINEMPVGRAEHK
jgi:hypothetical protein